MLEPRETDIPALFLVFVILPLVTYILLGKWSESSKNKERITFLAQQATHPSSSFGVPLTDNSTFTPISVLPPLPNNSGVHLCAKCFSPATTRCSQCKSTRYCSGKCQIDHWRQVHKHECVPLESNSTSTPLTEEFNGGVLFENTIDSQVMPKSSISEDVTYSCTDGYENEAPSFSYTTMDNSWVPPNNDDDTVEFSESKFASKKSHGRYKGIKQEYSRNYNGLNDSQTESFDGENLYRNGNIQIDDTTDLNCVLTKRVNKSQGIKRHKSPKQIVNKSREHDRNGQIVDESSKVTRIKDTVPLQGSKGIMRMIGLKKSSKLDRDSSVINGDTHKKVKMLFPYEEFIKFFQCEVVNLSPRGFLNCGNSCYANAVLQCLTCTKPLTNYLLRRSHSSSCCVKDWCLMCELEQHLLMLQERGGPLSPSRILSHIRRINRQIGNGSQEDAHEFLRLLVASMQSICLESFGGEKVVNPRLQETTFVQHTFGGRLKSKVKCLRCNHESICYENIMDLTLEIFGWVESLEDALTQYTSPEDLDGENMYRCGRCVAYVRAWKQLSIQVAPNILTIVLKRFQEGNYGKINKCISFPEILDMTPYMTGTDDLPPIYKLYAVIVHLDTLNASFSGHYISYVKDLLGNWFRIDDTEVQPVSVSQVMSEGAYMLFYMRSAPRPARTSSKKRIPKESPSRSDKSLRYQQVKSNHETCMEYSDATTSSDWSIFTSSDEASFTTESTRDSFSTDGANSDPIITSIFSSLYTPEQHSHSNSNSHANGNLSRKSVACSMFSGTMTQTRFFIESEGLVSVNDERGSSLCNDSNCSIHVGYPSNYNYRNGPQTSVYCNF